MLLAEYFIFIVFKDSFIMLSQFFFGGFLGFWHAIVLHIVTIPMDLLVLIVLSTWGTAVLHQDDTSKCYEDSECAPFIVQARSNVTLGYSYIFGNLFIKPGVFIFCFWFRGLKWMQEDRQEESDWQQRRDRGRVISQLRSGTFGSLYGVVRNHLYDTRQSSASSTQPQLYQNVPEEDDD